MYIGWIGILSQTRSLHGCNQYVKPKVLPTRILDRAALESILECSVLSSVCVGSQPPFAYKVKVLRSSLFAALRNASSKQVCMLQPVVSSAKLPSHSM